VEGDQQQEEVADQLNPTTAQSSDYARSTGKCRFDYSN
jgi:hypothetical protein